jgi:hypothetical protein
MPRVRSAVANWLSGWYETLMIKYRSPKLYRLIKDFTDDDFWEKDN